jgi:hypothetical protein
MKINIKDVFNKQAEWQKSRKAESWGDKIRQSEKARDSLGTFGYRASTIDQLSWALREKQ